MKTRSQGILIIAVATAVLLVGLVVYTLMRKQETPPPEQPTSPEQSIKDSTPTSRTVAGTPWRYTVNPELERKFSLAVVSENDGASLRINAKGCNHMSATVTTEQPDSEAAKRTINDTTYYLGSIIGTLMACTGEAATYDAQASAALRDIFASNDYLL